MNHLKHALKQFLQDESGQDLIEYALVAALVALGCVAGMQNLAQDVINAFQSVSDTLAATISS